MGIQDVGAARWCDNCSVQFVAHSTKARFCSSKCKQQDYRKRKTENSNTKRLPGRPAGNRVCNHCGKRFVGRSDAKFCKGSCRTMANRQRQRETWLMVKRETIFTDFDIYDTADRLGWSFWYKEIEKWGYVWIDSQEQYWRAGLAEAAKLI